MKIKVRTRYTIFENPFSEEIRKNTPTVKAYLKDGVISTFVRKNSGEAARPIYEDREYSTPSEADEAIDKFIQYPREFIRILRKAFEFHNEEPLKDKDRYYLKGFQRKSDRKKAAGDEGRIKNYFLREPRSSRYYRYTSTITELFFV